ncbi:MAG: tetratricopeptide repeat protein [Acidobacteriota bacterium]
MTFAAPVPPEQPAALILSVQGSNVEIARSSSGIRLRAHPGMVLFVGERLIQETGAVQLAFCGRHEIVSISAPSKVQLRSADYVAERGQVSSVPTPVCRLPMIHREPMPNNIWPFGGREVQAESLETLLRELAPEPQATLRAALEGIDANVGTSIPTLLLDVARAAALDEAGIWTEASVQYHQIRDRWPEADWTRDAIERMRQQELYRPSADQLGAGEESGHVFAFVVGVSDYQQPEIKDLQYADHDAATFAQYLESDRGGGLKRGKNLLLLLNHEATRDRVTANLAAFVQGKATGKNTLIIYIAAHGAYACVEKRLPSEPCVPGQDDEEPYILMHDSHPEDPKLTGIRMGDLHDLITAHAGSFGTVILYLDICHGGALGSLPLRSNLTSPQVKDTFADALRPDAPGDVGLLLASSRMKPNSRKDEFALEESFLDGGHGTFTYFVLRGLNGDVPPQKNTILIGDLMNHVRSQVRELTGNRQTPDLSATRPSIVLVADTSRRGIELQEIPPNIRKQIVKPRSPQADEQLIATILADSAEMPQVIQRAAEEESGQQQLLIYLKGEQVPQVRGDFEKCARNFERALAVAEDAAFTESRQLFCAGRAQIFNKHYAEAEALLERSIRIDRKRAYSYNALGIAHLEQAGFDQAILAFQNAINLAPDWAYPVHNLALAQEQAGFYNEAIATYRRAMSLAPYASYPSYNLALLLQRLNRLDDAQAMYQIAIRTALADRRSNPNAPPRWSHLTEAYNALGTLAAAAGRTKAAREHFLNAIQQDPANLVAQHNLALLEAGPLRAMDRAEVRWREILAMEPQGGISSVVRLSLAESLAESGKIDESIAEYRALLGIDPSFTAARRGLAVAYLGNGGVAEAMSVIEEVPGKAGFESVREDLKRILDGKEPLDGELARAYRRGRSRRTR